MHQAGDGVQDDPGCLQAFHNFRFCLHDVHEQVRAATRPIDIIGQLRNNRCYVTHMRHILIHSEHIDGHIEGLLVRRRSEVSVHMPSHGHAQGGGRGGGFVMAAACTRLAGCLCESVKLTICHYRVQLQAGLFPFLRAVLGRKIPQLKCKRDGQANLLQKHAT